MTKKTSPAYRASKEETIPINKLHPFSNHPFHIRHDLEFSELVDSISESGIITPIIVRPKVGVGYEVISGHRRWEACKELGIESIPARVEYIDDDEATILMVNSNIQREHVLPSEKAFAYKMRMEAMKHQGKATSSQLGTKLRTLDAMGKEVDESRRGKALASQANVNAMAQAIENAIVALKYKGANYTKVDAAIDKANALKKEDYKDFSGVEAAVNAVVRDKNITDQSKVDAMAQAIEDAIAALQYKDADYTKVDAAIAKANALNKDNYKDFSAVETAVNAVARGKNITEQGEVDAMAKAIEDALAALQYKDADKTTPAPATPAPAATATPAPAATATPAPAATATPQYTIPQTGDTSNPALLVVLMLVSGSAAIGTAVVGSKKKHNR